MEKDRYKLRYWLDPEKSRKEGREKYARNKEKIKARRKKNMALLVERSERNRYFRKYGLTLEEARVLKSEGCTVCKSKIRPHIDHDHITGKVRGVLCQKCNQALGLLGEDVERIESLLFYIDYHLSRGGVCQ